MIYQPRNVNPAQKSIDGDVLNNYFSMEINTNDKVVGYELTILNWDNTVRYVQDKVNLSTPLYNGDTLSFLIPSSFLKANLENGFDYKWYVRLYQDTPNMYITYGIIQSVNSETELVLQKNINVKAGMSLKYNNELKTITAYSDNTGIATIESAFTSSVLAGAQYQIYSDFIQTVPEYILHVRKTPDVEIIDIPSEITTKKYTFNGTYSQADGVPLSYHRWTLGITDKDNPSIYTIVQTTGKVYNCNLTYTYDGLKNGINYVIILETENEFGISNHVTKYFSVSYNEIEYLEKPSAKVDYSKNAIQLDWVAPTEFAPKAWNTNISSGTVLPGDIGSNSFYISRGLTNIFEDNIITINNVEMHIKTYDTITGLVTVKEDLPESLVVGSNYYIQGYDGLGVSDATTLYRNTPYEKTNSVDTKVYKLIYESDKGDSIGEYPDDWEITMQFKPNKDFFYGTTGVFRDIIDIASVESDAADKVSGMILIFAHIYDIVGVYPENTNGVANIQTLKAPPSGESNTEGYMYLNNAIDLNTTSYIYFPEYSYIEKISNFDSTTLKATFNSPLPFVPAAGDQYVMMVTLKTAFYSNPNNQWLLQTSNKVNSAYDYRWIDENNTWDDTKYWVEGGTAIVRIAESWWKVKLTKDSIKLEKGGI